jgi:hypothetical protein
MIPSGRPYRFADLARQVLSAPPLLGAVRLVCVDGPACSGKTTLASRLAEALAIAGGVASTAVPVLHMDDLYEGWDGLPTVADRLEEWVLEPLQVGRPGRYRRFDWSRNAYAEWHEVPADCLAVVVEGVGAANRRVDGRAVRRIWVEAPDATRLARATNRDGGAFGPYWDAWAQAETAHFAADETRARADLVVDGAPEVAYDPRTELVVSASGTTTPA